MAMAEAAPRAREFFKGFAWPFIIALGGVAVWAVFVAVPFLHDLPNAGGTALEAYGFLTLGACVFLAYRFWDESRTRAWGVVAGLLVLPVVLIALFVAWVVIFNVPIGPR